ncbi:hypothetical protein ADL26_11590, partial [Thermoactinomyces vulgaris]
VQLDAARDAAVRVPVEVLHVERGALVEPVVDEDDDLGGARAGLGLGREAREAAGVLADEFAVPEDAAPVLDPVEDEALAPGLDVGADAVGGQTASARVGGGGVEAAGHGHQRVELDPVDFDGVGVGL